MHGMLEILQAFNLSLFGKTVCQFRFDIIPWLQLCPRGSELDLTRIKARAARL